MSRAVCPGSFDPVTHGHLDIIERTANMFDEVIVAVGKNRSKNALFEPAERVEMLSEACSEWPGVRVQLFEGLLVDFCSANRVDVIVKGLRFVSDFDYELQMAQMNHQLTGIDTVFMPAAAAWSYVSSSLVREVATLGGDVEQFLPPSIARLTAERIAARLTGSS
ncbi:pantetheine-phosphate adenylyltransferase [Microlunatus panaciterrae]|uniref:Phosphopantetheine adenylyltransferase n=1 Tax=Microlunatus panaciterrae TaxID=400768 RepID=A0ABS2RMV5_9ACTN|nr:pantetheine-phosphate adenylyltransferase [Microlunatus panaciterrae]MBM7800345.1 pantetheine-phosphate adenylyltransferase [Microlunatus panaciterrae]